MIARPEVNVNLPRFLLQTVVAELDGGDAVIGNLVGEVSIEKALKIATQMKTLPPGLMEKLTGFNSAGNKEAAQDNQPETFAEK